VFVQLHSLIPDISISPLQVHYYSETLQTTALILSELTRRSATSTYAWRTCPWSLRGG